MASIISELRSVTLSQSTTVFVSEINIQKHNRMAPKLQDTLPKSSDFEVEHSQKLSPVSNLGTSVDSSPPVLSSNDEHTEAIKENKFEKTEDPSSNDSGSVQNYIVNETEYQSPLSKLESSLKKDGRLGKKLHATSPSPKNHIANNWMISTPTSIFDRDTATTSSGIVDRNIPSSVIHHNSLSSTSDRTFASFPSTSTSNCNSGHLVSTAIYHGNLPSTSNGIFHENLPSNSNEVFDLNHTFSCRKCDFTCFSQIEYNAHMNLHNIHKCPRPQCNYTSPTEGRLKRHVKEFHSDTPPESWAGTRTSRMEIANAEQLLDNSVTSSNGKTRTFRCKHCTFVTYQKKDFWKHSATHIKPDKLLQCEQCDFVTEYKHHYEYHVANHSGFKPFKCSMCNYRCVNKSMLNSHLKSHSNVYQFHCADCKYETKYCHSIKQHLKKQNHKPGLVLNQDGSPCPFQVIDVYGRRRGPRVKKRKESAQENSMISSVPSSNQQGSSSSNQHSIPYSTAVSMLRPNISSLYPSFYGDYSQNLMMRTSPQMNSSSFPMPVSISGRNHNCFACSMCPFMTSEQDTLKRHMVLHIASENQDIAKLYGINPEFFHDQQMSLNKGMNGHRSLIEPDENDKKLFPSAVENSFPFQEDFRGYKQEHEMLLDDQNMKSEDGSSPKYRRNSSPMNDDNDSYKEYSSPSPLDSSSHSPDFISFGNKKDTQDHRTSPAFILNENRMEDNESPIDLSGCKSSDSVKMDKTEDLDLPSSELSMTALPSKMESSNAFLSQRNRRKGKAYKINHYLQYDEQSSHQEFVKDDTKNNSLEACKSNIASDAKQPCKEHHQNFKAADDASVENKNDLSKATVNCTDLKYDCRSSPTYSTNSASNQNNNPLMSNSDNSVKKDVKKLVPYIECIQLDPVSNSEKIDKPVRSENSTQQDIYECQHCEIIFRDLAMYSVHMGYHGYMNPYQCNLCGQITNNAVEFFVHIARVSHT